MSVISIFLNNFKKISKINCTLLYLPIICNPNKREGYCYIRSYNWSELKSFLVLTLNIYYLIIIISYSYII